MATGQKRDGEQMGVEPTAEAKSLSLQDEIKQVNQKIEQVETKIVKAEAELEKAEAAGDALKTAYWRKKEEQLREEKNRLREEKNQLREEKNLLSKEKEQLREKELKLLDLQTPASGFALKQGQGECHRLCKSNKLFEIASPLIKAIKSGSLRSLPATNDDGVIQVFEFGQSAGEPKFQLETPAPWSDRLFILPWYTKLLSRIFSTAQRRFILLGNPGIGKSLYQFYIMTKLLRSDLFDVLPSPFKCIKVVARQRGQESLVIYDLERETETKYSVHEHLHFFEVLSGLNQEESLYLFDADQTKAGPYSSGIKMRTICTLSPDEDRYKEYVKNAPQRIGATILYFPVWAEEEINTAAKHLSQQFFVGDVERKKFLTDVEQSFQRFGGIFRHIFEIDHDKRENYKLKQTKSISDVDPKKVFNAVDIGPNSMSHFILHYAVPTEGEMPFLRISVKFASDFVFQTLRARLEAVDLSIRVAALVKNDQVPTYMGSHCKEIFESVIFDLMTRLQGLSLKFRLKSEKILKEKTIKLVAAQGSELPTYKAMHPNTLYFPKSSTYPVVDMFWVEVVGERRNLFGLQVTRGKQRRPITEKLLKFWKKVEFDESLGSFTYIFCPSVGIAKDIKDEIVVCEDKSVQIEFWELYSDYGLRYKVKENDSRDLDGDDGQMERLKRQRTGV